MNAMHATISAKTRYRFVFFPIYCVVGHALFKLFCIHSLILVSLHDFHIRLKRNTKGVTSGAEITYHSVASDVTYGFQWNSCCAVFSFICSALSFCPFSFNNCIVCPSMYHLCLHLWYPHFLLLIPY